MNKPADTPNPDPPKPAEVEVLKDRLSECEADKDVLKHIIIKQRDKT